VIPSLAETTAAAETEWLELWTSGPVEAEGTALATGTSAPDLVLADHTGRLRSLSEFWSEGPALVMFWRHFGCGCGAERAKRLVDEIAALREAGLELVIIGQGEPVRAAAYRDRHGLPCPILCDPHHDAYRAWGIGHWPVERVLFDAPSEYWGHPHDLGARLQDDRRSQGNPTVDDPWRAVAEFVVSGDGSVRLAYSYQHCEDFPDVRVLTTAARLA
jgi:peroxiredoxin